MGWKKCSMRRSGQKVPPAPSAYLYHSLSPICVTPTMQSDNDVLRPVSTHQVFLRKSDWKRGMPVQSSAHELGHSPTSPSHTAQGTERASFSVPLRG